MLHQADIYEPKKILTLRVNLPIKRYTTPEKQAAWYMESLERLRAIPGVTHAEVTAAMPYSDNAWVRDFTIENRPVMPGKIPDSIESAGQQRLFRSFSHSYS